MSKGSMTYVHCLLLDSLITGMEHVYLCSAVHCLLLDSLITGMEPVYLCSAVTDLFCASV